MSITLKLDNIEQARSLYHKADAAMKEVLKSSLPGLFSENPLERLTTFEACCYEIGVDPNKYKEVEGESDEDRSDRFYQRLKIIHKAFRQAYNWTAKLGDPNQVKYWVYLCDFKPGSGFSDSDDGSSLSASHVGSRLYLPSREVALFVGKTFLSEFNGYQL